MMRLAIIGSGDLGQLIAYHADQDRHYLIAGFFDDYQEKGKDVGEYKVIGRIDEIKDAFSNNLFDCLIIAVGYKHFKQRSLFFERFYGQVPFGKIIHSSSFVDPSCNVGDGVMVLPGCILDKSVTIENNVLLNTGCTIAHDSIVQKHSFLSPRVAVAGFVSIGSCCNLGINSTIIDNLHITDNVQTGGGTVVIESIKKSGLYVGNPARLIR